MKGTKPEWLTEDYPSYQQIVASWGYPVAKWIELGDYQGDYLVLLRDGEKWGFLCIGYGSCSGCDWLEDAYSYGSGDWDEVISLAEKLRGEIVWKENPWQMSDFLLERDGLNSYWYGDHDSDGPRAVADLIDVVQGRVREL